MRRHGKASSSGSSMRQGSRPSAVIRGAVALALACVAFCGIGASAAMADNLPTISAETASEVGVTTVKLSGKVNPNGEAGTGNATWRLQYSPAGDEAWVNASEGTIEAPATEEANDAEVEAIFGFGGELRPGEEYEFRLQAENGAGLAETAGPYPTFTMDAATAPTVTTVAATAITISKAHIAAKVDPEGGNVNPIGGPLSIAWTLEYTKASEPGAWQSGGSGQIEGSDAESPPDPIAIGADLTGLSSGTEYLYRAVLTYAGGGSQVTSSNGTFTTTASSGPTASTGTASHIQPGQAQLSGTVNPNEEPTLYWFEYGPAPCDSSTCTAAPAAKDANAGEGTEALLRSKAIGGLEPSTIYHFRLLAENPSGTAQGLDQTFTTAAAPANACPNDAFRTELHATELGNCRAWELASPGTNNDIIADAGRTVAATTESPGLPMAAKFSSLAGSADALGSGIGFDFLTQRDAISGTSGWAVHAITPPQEPLTFAAAIATVDPLYETFSSDLSTGVFRSFSSLPGTSANAAEVPNLYLRDDIRTPGSGAYQFLSDSSAPQPPLTPSSDASIEDKRPWLAGASTDLQHVLFETKLNLTPDATGENAKLYKSDEGVVHLVRASGVCSGLSGTNGQAPCSMAGIGATAIGGSLAHYTPRVISADGSRVNLTSPFGTGLATIPNGTAGVASKLYQLDDRGTAATDDDALIQLSMSEKGSPEAARGAIYDTASTDGSRVFFRSAEQLTETPDSGLYMWERQDENETQQLSVDATGGTFTVTAHAQPSTGEGELTEGSTTVNMGGIGTPGSFTVGQVVSAPGIPASTTVTQVGTFSNNTQKKVVLSNPATENGTQEFTASFQASTGPLPFNVTAAQVQKTLEGLNLIGTGNVVVSGGPGASAPFDVEFTGALAGVNVMPLTTDPTDLSDGASTAIVTTTNDVHNLTLIGPGATGVLGASVNGHRLYFNISASAGLDEILNWQDADGTPGGSLSHVASLNSADTKLLITGPKVFWNFGRQPLSRVTPDGRSLLFEATDGASLPPAYQHGPCDGNATGSNNGQCAEAYLYRADTSTPTDPDIVCASCDLAGPGAPGDTLLNARERAGASQTTSHLNRALSDDGNHVFFDTDENLVEEDTNGAVDVYEYDVPTGEAHLISGGIDPAPSYLMDSSADGSDVFFATRAQLAGWDEDYAYDLYDARINGGFANPPAEIAPCEGESCRSGGAPSTPGAAAPGSAFLVGPPNPKGGRKNCPKGKRAVRKNGKTRCVKKHHNQKRTANTNRRASR